MISPLNIYSATNCDSDWNLFIPQETPTVTLYHGTKSTKLDLTPLKAGNAESIKVEPEIAAALLLPKHTKSYQIRPLNSRHYILGPLIGIFINDTKLNNLKTGKIDPIYRRFAQVLQRNKGLAVFFTLSGVSWEKGQLTGVVRDTIDGKEVWREEILAIPHVIYDRCFGPTGRMESFDLRTGMISYDPRVLIINALTKLRKLQVYKLCAPIPSIKQYLPRWTIVTRANIANSLKQYPVAYIKPDTLFKGKGITKLSCLPSGFLVEQRRDDENYRHLCSSTEEIIADLEPYLSCYGFMVIQEAIPLMTYMGNPFDFRLLLQKDLTGKWKNSGLVARVSAQGSVVSSPRSGGTVATFDMVMAHLPKPTRTKIFNSLTHLALEIAKTIENSLGLYAELGLDLGIDVNGSVRIIEVNGKPLKVSLDRLKDHTFTCCAYENPLEYAMYLAGFGGRNLG